MPVSEGQCDLPRRQNSAGYCWPHTTCGTAEALGAADGSCSADDTDAKGARRPAAAPHRGSSNLNISVAAPLPDAAAASGARRSALTVKGIVIWALVW